jgi:hypothetical protein
MRWWSERAGDVECSFSDPELLTAIGEADDWMDSATGNPAPSEGYNAALTSIGLSTEQKGEILALVALVRLGVTAGLADAGEYARRVVQTNLD